MSERIFEHSPAWVIEDDTVVGFDLAFSQGLRVHGIDTVARTDASVNALSGRLCSALSNLPGGTVLRWVSAETASYAGYLQKYRDQFAHSPLGSYIARKKVEQCSRDADARRRELFCFVSTACKAPLNAQARRALGLNPMRVFGRVAAMRQERTAAVGRVRKTLERELDAVGVRAHWMRRDELFGSLWRLTNPVLSRGLASPTYRTDVTLRSQLFAGAMHNRVDHFAAQGHLHRVVSLRVGPRHVQPMQILDLCALSFPHHVVVTLVRVDDREAERRLKAVRLQGHELNRLLAKLRGSERNEQLPDHDVLRQHAESDDALERLSAGEVLYDVAAQIWFAAGSPRELAERTDVVLGQVRTCGQAEGALEEPLPHLAFVSMLPGHHGLMGDRYHPMLASRAADMLPIFQSHGGGGKPCAIVCTRRHEVVGFEPFDKELQAWNATIAGGTGSGKSFTTRTLLSGWVAQGGRLVVITRGGDYRRFAETFGGSVNEVALGEPGLSLSPFPARAELGADLRGDGRRATLIDHLASIIGMMASEPGAADNRVRRRLVYQATRRLYSDGCDALPSFDGWLTALHALVGDEGKGTAAEYVESIEAQLRFWVDGPYGEAFCRGQTETRSDALSVWNLASIADADTQGVVLALLSGLIARSISDGPTIVVMDEVWSILRTAAGAQLVETLYRTVRKEGSAIWTISQSMNDYTGLPESCRSAILNNSPIKVFLAHDSSEIDLVSRTFKFNERESELLASLRSVPGEFSEMLLFFGPRRQVLQLIPTGIEYWLATSHPKDLEELERARAAYPNKSGFALLKALARRYPHGALDPAA